MGCGSSEPVVAHLSLKELIVVEQTVRNHIMANPELRKSMTFLFRIKHKEKPTAELERLTEVVIKDMAKLRSYTGADAEEGIPDEAMAVLISKHRRDLLEELGPKLKPTIVDSMKKSLDLQERKDAADRALREMIYIASLRSSMEFFAPLYLNALNENNSATPSAFDGADFRRVLSSHEWYQEEDPAAAASPPPQPQEEEGNARGLSDGEEPTTTDNAENQHQDRSSTTPESSANNRPQDSAHNNNSSTTVQNTNNSTSSASEQQQNSRHQDPQKQPESTQEASTAKQDNNTTNNKSEPSAASATASAPPTSSSPQKDTTQPDEALTEEDLLAYPLPEGTWTKDGDTGYYWSDELGCYYYPAAGHYYYPSEETPWYVPDLGEYLTEEDHDALLEEMASKGLY